jgi:hypothetical protein
MMFVHQNAPGLNRVTNYDITANRLEIVIEDFKHDIKLLILAVDNCIHILRCHKLSYLLYYYYIIYLW